MLCKASTYFMTVFLAASTLLVKPAAACDCGSYCGGYCSLPDSCSNLGCGKIDGRCGLGGSCALSYTCHNGDCDYTCYCTGGCMCSYDRRSLQELTDADILTESEVEARLVDCGEYMHNLDLAITSQHLLFIIQPSAQAEGEGCLPMAIHATFREGNTKQVLGFPSISALEDIGFTTEHGVILDMSSFTLENIMEAYRMASAVPEGVDEHAAYDVIDNNCGGFLVNMLNNLNYQYPDGFAGLLASILYYQGGSEFADSIREAAEQIPKNKKFKKKLDKLDDTELIKWVVDYTIERTTEEKETRA